jgi:hypothetical protein
MEATRGSIALSGHWVDEGEEQGGDMHGTINDVNRVDVSNRAFLVAGRSYRKPPHAPTNSSMLSSMVKNLLTSIFPSYSPMVVERHGLDEGVLL